MSQILNHSRAFFVVNKQDEFSHVTQFVLKLQDNVNIIKRFSLKVKIKITEVV